MMTALQIWLQNHNLKLTQDAIDEALMEYIAHIDKQATKLQHNLEASTVRLNESLYQQSRLQAENEALRKDAERYLAALKNAQSYIHYRCGTPDPEDQFADKILIAVESEMRSAIEQAKEGCPHEWDSDGDPGPGETMTLQCRHCGEEQQAKGA